MSKIHIHYMTDEAIETLKKNQKKVTEYMKANQNNSSWISNVYSGDLYTEKKFMIDDFSLRLASSSNKYTEEVGYENAITIYEALKDLPAYVLTDERFWAWINFDYCYKAAMQAMPITSKSTFINHWVFGAGQRRGVFFGVFSREFYRVALSVDNQSPDKYEYTKFVYDNPERIRNLTWRANSSNRKLVLSAIKAEKKAFDYCDSIPEMSELYKKAERGQYNLYTELAKYISLYGSVRLIDVVSEEDMIDEIYSEMIRFINEKREN